MLIARCMARACGPAASGSAAAARLSAAAPCPQQRRRAAFAASAAAVVAAPPPLPAALLPLPTLTPAEKLPAIAVEYSESAVPGDAVTNLHHKDHISSSPFGCVLSDPSVVYFSSSDLFSADKPPDPAGVEGSNSSDNRPSHDTLRRVVDLLTYDLSNAFLVNPNMELYREDIVLENRIDGKTTVGLAPYVYQAKLLKIVGHVKFAYIRFDLTSMRIHEEDGTVVARWRILGMPVTRLVALYLPKRLWRKDNLEREATVWKEGLSTFHVDAAGKVFRHVVDNKEEDRGKKAAGATSVQEQLKEKLQKLKERAPKPAPAM